MTENATKTRLTDRFINCKWFPAVIWTLRLLVGAIFIMSGFVKGVDLWGFVFKIEEYLAVWGSAQPRSLVVMAAMLICGYEFVFGFMLATGCYKRVAPLALLVQMCIMLPLTGYILIENPVSDCGCFGDFLVLSNGATFVKNLVITLLLVFLVRFNSTMKLGIFKPAIQWMVGAWISLYFIIIALFGYNVQPMLDFRQYPIGTSLIPSDEEAEADEDDAAADITFIYERDGEKKEFSIDNLPDSTWTFVERIELAAPANNATDIIAIDENGEDATDEAITAEGPELLLVIPETQRIDISYTYFLNELKQWTDSAGVKMSCLIAANRKGIDFWKDVSMASYDVYAVDDTKLKELSRGTMSLVELQDGVIKAKYTLNSIKGEIFDNGPHGADLLDRMNPNVAGRFRRTTIFFAVCLLALFLFQSLILAINSQIRALYQKKAVNLQTETAEPDSEDSDYLNHNKPTK